MATEKQKLGDRGESLIRKNFSCLKCKRSGTLKPLIKNFKSVNNIKKTNIDELGKVVGSKKAAFISNYFISQNE